MGQSKKTSLQEFKEEIKSRIDIVEIIESYIPLKRSGKGFTALCPFHPDKNPSFYVNPQIQMYHCFACGASGDVFKFITEYTKVDFMTSLKTLAQRIGLEVPSFRTPGKEIELKQTVLQIHKTAQELFLYNFWKKPEGKIAQNYLTGRNFSPKTWEFFGLGYSTGGWQDLTNYLLSKNYSIEDIVKSGLTVESEKGKYYDRFRERLMFPITDYSGNIIAFGSRILFEKEEPKYINSPETDIYQKSKILYNFSNAQKDIRRENEIILVEGYTDVMRLYENGIRNVCAISGSTLTDEQAYLIKRYTDNVILFFDGDSAGRKATLKAISSLLKRNINIKVIPLNDNEDPDSYLSKNKFTAKEELIKEAIFFMDYLLIEPV